MTNVVKLIQHRITPLEGEKDNVNILRTFHRDDYKSLDAAIESLEQGDRYKQMCESFMDEWDRVTDNYVFHNKKIDKKEIKRLSDYFFNLKN